MKIFIDPGHGGADPGAISANGLREANINLDVAKRLGNILRARNYQIKFSRTTNISVTLSKRAQLANDWGANYFISIHCNSVQNPQANGTETLVYRLNTTAARLADNVQYQLILQNGLRNRGVKSRNLAVLRLTRMPAILTELAFISNPNEAYLLSTTEFRQRCAQGIADGITEFLKRQ